MTVRLSPSIAISVGVHALLAVGWWLAPESEKPSIVAPKAAIELVDPVPEETAVEVVMLDEAVVKQLPSIAAPAAPSKAAPIKPVAKARSAPKIASAASVTQPEIVAPPVAPIESKPSAMFDFRKGIDLEGRGRDALRIKTPALERIALGGEVAPPSVVIDNHAGAIVDPKVKESIVSAEITPGGRGGYKVDDLVFKGRIEKDGSVTLKDKPNIQHQFKSWKHIKRVLMTSGPFGLLQLDFDVTAAVMKAKKMDPYASRKLAFLDETRDARVELGKQHRTEVLAKTSQIVTQNLQAISGSITNPAELKSALFEIWDEVDETGDEELVEAGKAARMAVIGFIRGRLPQGSAKAFSDEEIARYNQHRHSKAAFAPY